MVSSLPLEADGSCEIPANLRELLGPHSSLGAFLLISSVPRNPNGEGLPDWPVYDQKEGYLQIGATTQAAQKLKDKEMAFWTELLAKKAAKKPLQTERVEL